MIRRLSDVSDWSESSGLEVGNQVEKCDIELHLPKYKHKVMTRKPETRTEKWYNAWHHSKIEEGKGMMDLRLMESQQVMQRHKEAVGQRERSANRKKRREKREREEHHDGKNDKTSALKCIDSMESSMLPTQKEFGHGAFVMGISRGGGFLFARQPAEGVASRG